MTVTMVSCRKNSTCTTKHYNKKNEKSAWKFLQKYLKTDKKLGHVYDVSMFLTQRWKTNIFLENKEGN